MSLPDEYLTVLEHLGRAFATYKRETAADPILVGGAATALRTDGAFMSADFDVIATDNEAFARAMTQAGFIAEGGIGHLASGFRHSDHPDYVVEQVSGPLFDGLADKQRMVRLTTDGGTILLPAIEDLIADRLGQHAVASRSDTSRLLQAKALFAMAESIDRHYLCRRILEEGGDPLLIGLSGDSCRPSRSRHS
jgi:hypothetical protein